MSRDVKVLAGLPDGRVSLRRALATSIRNPDASKGLPERTAMVLSHEQDVERAAAYARVCGFAVKEQVPATWLHVLTFPLQTWVMDRPDFPFALPGLVHVRNEMRMHRPVGVRERLRLAVWPEGLAPHKRGVTFDVRGAIHVGDELVWEGASTYLSAKAKLPGEPAAAERLPMPEAGPAQRWELPADLGRRYAAASGDRNPIHTSQVAAKLFGFPRPIIHGMWTHARALAAFGGTLPESYRVRVQFTKPIVLPARVSFATDRDGERFAVLGRDGKPRMVGALEAQAVS